MRRRASGRSGRLLPRQVSVRSLAPSARRAMWCLFSRFYAEVDPDRFARDLDQKDDVILLHDSGDGSIQGFSTLQRMRDRIEGRSVVAIFSGDTIVHPDYWGQTALQRAFVRVLIVEKLRNPLTPVYWFLISKGYKTYLLLTRNFPRHFPRHDRPTPRWEQAVLDRFAMRKYPEHYRPDRGVIEPEQGEGRLRHDVAPIDIQLYEQPDIRFFAEQNPGHVLGHELCCLAESGPTVWAYFGFKLVRRRLARIRAGARKLWAVATALF